ncbi:MAG: hypothetical protein AB1716_07190 [Planctomycetota bacterium]
MGRGWLVAVGVLGLAGLVAPMPAGAQAIGPDVIVGDLHETTRWGAGANGTIQAYSVGTVSCNIGDTPLQWNGTTNQHPVIGQNLFRLKDGRFEQVGQSWLKWAYVSLNQSFCGTCQNPGTGYLLGVNCSDPYSATLNGSQGRLGPKSVVNPFTGYFPTNHAHPGSGTIDGRLQVHTADVDPAQNAGARYFIEGQYVAPDDSASGNYRNNASYRQVWVNPATFSLSFSNPQGGGSSTVRMDPAILAWKVQDPGVSLTSIDVPSDGELIIGVRATSLGAAGWRYELAIQNLNSDRSVGGVFVPLPPGTNVANVGFHDVDYHSGEPYDGTDWPGQVVAGGVQWQTAAYGVDPNANALRWGTLYNFRFDASVGPQFVREVELTLFQPGTPAALTAALDQGRYLLGDLNCDGAVDFDDISPFVLALSDPAGHATAYPGCPISNGDVNGDLAVDFDDINPFVALLAG